MFRSIGLDGCDSSALEEINFYHCHLSDNSFLALSNRLYHLSKLKALNIGGKQIFSQSCIVDVFFFRPSQEEEGTTIARSRSSLSLEVLSLSLSSWCMRTRHCRFGWMDFFF